MYLELNEEHLKKIENRTTIQEILDSKVDPLKSLTIYILNLTE